MTDEEREVWIEDMANDAYMDSLDPEPTCETCAYRVYLKPYVKEREPRYCCIWGVVNEASGADVPEITLDETCDEWEPCE